MAQTSKKTTGRASSGGKRTAPSGSNTKKSTSAKNENGKNTSAKNTGKSGSAPARSSPVQERKPIRREVWALVCAALAVFSILGCFGVEAIFIDFFCGLMKGLLGYGFWSVPGALMLATYILAFHRGRPVRLRLSCALLLPLFISALVHSLIADSMEWGTYLFGYLWDTGSAMRSGGALAGMLAQSCVSLFSNLGAFIIFAMLIIVLGLAAFNRTLMDVADWIFNRPRYEYEEVPERPRHVREEKAIAHQESLPEIKENTVRRRVVYDIPVEDGPLMNSKSEESVGEPIPKKQKGSFFDRKAKVPAPDQVLTEQKKPAQPLDEIKTEVEAEPPAITSEPVCQESERVEAKIEEPVAPPVPLDVHETAAMPVSSQPPAKQEKVTKQEAQVAAQQVAEDIQRGLETKEEEIPYQYPPLSLLTEGEGSLGGDAMAELNANRQRLSDTIHSFGIEANIVNVTRGPSVTRYELELDQGVRLNKLTNLADDIALALGAAGVRIAPIPDQISMVGIEVPNKLVSPVNIHSVIGSKAFTESKSKVSFAVGKDIGGNAIVGNIAKMPHMLIAGTTGSGKSVCTNSLIISLLYKATPEEVRLIMVDPKMVELGIYNGIPHLLIPVVTDPKKAAGALQWAVFEMMKRYKAFSEVGVRDLASYNAKAAKTDGMEKMPQVVIIIDELADLMLVAAKEVEESICRVAQMGRASGMHLIIATQRPSADVITGLMKANIPSRIAFAVASSLESRIILDITGAEKLVGRGDMLYFPLGSGKPTRVQGCLITDQEVASVVEFIKQTGAAQYDDAVMQEIEQHAAEKEKGSKGVGGSSATEDSGGDYDELIDQATEVVVETGMASVSMLQRRLKLGYARAARLVDQLEDKGIVGPFEGSKPRQVLITKEQWQEMKYRKGTVVAPVVARPEPACAPVRTACVPNAAPISALCVDCDESVEKQEQEARENAEREAFDALEDFIDFLDEEERLDRLEAEEL